MLSLTGLLPTRLTLIRLLVCLSLCFQGCERQLPIQQSEKALFLRAQDLADHGFGFKSIEKYESFKKSKAIDGSYELEYAFKTPEEEQNDPMFLYVKVSVERKKSDAAISQGTEKIALLYGLKAKGVEEEEMPNFYRYGDASSFYLLKKEGKPIGIYFTVREGSKIYSILLTGMYIDDPQLWEEIIEPKLKEFSVYKPT